MVSIKHVYNDYVNTDMSYEELCRCYWQQKYGFHMVSIDKDSAITNDTEKDLMSMRYRNLINCCQYINITFSLEYNIISG